jgi:hypothetical protein
MHIVEVDMVDAAPLPRGVEGFANVDGAIVEEARAVFASTNRELGCERHPRTAAFVFGQELADHLFAQTIAINIGGVPEIDAEIERPRHRPHGLGFICRPVKAAEAHTAEANGRHRSMPPSTPSHRQEFPRTP